MTAELQRGTNDDQAPEAEVVASQHDLDPGSHTVVITNSGGQYVSALSSVFPLRLMLRPLQMGADAVVIYEDSDDDTCKAYVCVRDCVTNLTVFLL